MKIIVCGAGQVGSQIALHLSRERNDVTIIDTNPDLVARATDALDVEGVVGSACHPDVLERANAGNAQMIIAVTRQDEVNIVTCQIAESVFSIPKKVARLRSTAYRGLFEQGTYGFPVDVLISPEREVAVAVLDQLEAPETFETEDFLDGQLVMVGIQLGEKCSILDTPLRQLTGLFPTMRVIVAGVRRSGKLIVPDPDDQLYHGDEVYVFCHVDDRSRTIAVFSELREMARRIIIVGGGVVGLHLARRLEESREGIRSVVIELNRNVAERAADALERTIVLNGDGLTMEMLEEANVDRADAVVAVTQEDKTNILVGARAKALGSPLAISLVNDLGLASMRMPLGIDKFVNPMTVTVSSILRHIRQGRVVSVYTVGDAQAEIIELEVTQGSPIAGKPIRRVGIPKGSRVVGIRKNVEVFCPKGDTVINVGDHVVIFSLFEEVKAIDHLI